MKTQTLKLQNLLIFSGIVIALLFALSAWAWVVIPAGEPIPVHWGPNGEPDRFGGKFEGLLLLPIITTAVVGLLTLVPFIDPRKENILRSGPAYRAIWIGLLLFMALIHAAIIATVMGVIVPIDRVITIGIGALFMVIGNFMGKVRRNYMFGIRTPWTIASTLAWDKTHRICGRLFFLLGLVMAIGGLFVGGVTMIILMLIGLFSILIFSLVYSYTVWKNDPELHMER